LVLYENFNNKRFKNWLRLNSIVASVFTLFSATNIEVINILNSKLGGFYIFSATFTKKTESLIFWFSLINFIIKDIPQFGIQVINYLINYFFFIEKKINQFLF